MFSWVIAWIDSGEIAIKPGYAYPHTALMGARAFVKKVCSESENIKVWVVKDDAETATRKLDDSILRFEGAARYFARS